MLSAWRRDYRLSLVLLVAGIVMVAAYFAFGGWTNSIGNSTTTFGAGLCDLSHRSRRGHVDSCWPGPSLTTIGKASD